MNIFAGFRYKSKTMTEIEQLEKNFSTSRVDEIEKSVVSFEGRGLRLESEKDASQVTEEIDRAKTVHGIIFKGNTVGVEAAKKIGESLAKRSEFERALWSDMFTGRSKAEIPPALIGLCDGIQSAGAKLVELDLSDNAFGPNGARGVEAFLRSPSAWSLEILKLNNNGLGIAGGKMIAAALKDCFHSSKAAGTPLKLRVFVGGRNRLENAGATALSEIFKLVGTLEEVTMPQNGIYAAGIAALSNAFAHNPKMRVINLSDNTFTEEGAKAFADVLPKMKSLEVINFDDCLLRSNGGLVLADALKDSCPMLQELRLCGNELDKASGERLITSSSGKKDLKLLDLNSNAFGEDGLDSLVKLAQTFNLEKILGSFEDDEGESDDSSSAADESTGVGYESENEEESEPPMEPVKISEPKPDVVLNGSGDAPSSKPQVVQQFQLRPDAATLITLTEMAPAKMVDLTLDHLKHPENIVEFVFGVASLIDKSGPSEINGLAHRCCETLLKGAFETRDSTQLTNSILENLGVIKSETNLTKAANVEGALSMLSQVVKKEWFPPQSRNMLGFILERRKEKLGADESALTELMSSLAI